MLSCKTKFLCGLKASLHAHRDVLARTLPWIQALFLVAIALLAVIRDRSMILVLPGAAIVAGLIFVLVQQSLRGKRVATVILFPVALIALELFFHMSNKDMVTAAIGTLLYLGMLFHAYLLSSPWQKAEGKSSSRAACLVLVLLNTAIQTTAGWFEYQKHGEPWVGPPLQKGRVILFFVLFLLFTVWFLVRPHELSGKLCFLMNAMMNVAVTRNLLVTAVVTALSACIFFIGISPVYQVIADRIVSDDSPEDT